MYGHGDQPIEKRRQEKEKERETVPFQLFFFFLSVFHTHTHARTHAHTHTHSDTHRFVSHPFPCAFITRKNKRARLFLPCFFFPCAFPFFLVCLPASCPRSPAPRRQGATTGFSTHWRQQLSSALKRGGDSPFSRDGNSDASISVFVFWLRLPPPSSALACANRPGWEDTAPAAFTCNEGGWGVRALETESGKRVPSFCFHLDSHALSPCTARLMPYPHPPPFPLSPFSL